MQGFCSGQANFFSVIGWVADGFYLTPDTRLRLENVVLRAKLAGLDGPLDQSEAIEAALSGYLDQIEAEFDDGVGVKKRTRTRKKARWIEKNDSGGPNASLNQWTPKRAKKVQLISLLLSQERKPEPRKG